jgi:hypothetical protein
MVKKYSHGPVTSWTCLKSPKGCACRCHTIRSRAEIAQTSINWNDEQERFLYECIEKGMVYQQIAQAFAEKARTDGAFVPRKASALEARARYLGWRPYDYVWSLQDLCKIFGLRPEVVSHWHRMGLLTSNSNGSRAVKRILRTEVKEFVLRWSGILFDPSTITEPSLTIAARAGAIKNARRDE